MSTKSVAVNGGDRKIICCKCGSECKVYIDYADIVKRISIDHDIISMPFEVVECPICGRLTHMGA